MERPSRLDWSIPATVAGPITEEHQAVLLYVHSGAAVVEARGDDYRVTAGEAVWVPPGVPHRTRADVGANVLPVFPPVSELPESLSELRVVVVPSGWEDWLVQQYTDGSHIVQHVRDTLSGASSLLGLVVGSDGSGSEAATMMPTELAPRGLRLPRSRESLTVARTLLRDPASSRSAESFAAREAISVRTLQRQFRRETGLVFSEWRTRARIAAAAAHVADGRGVGWTGRYVGYATPAGFAKAFHRHTGRTPSEYAHDIRAGEPRHTIVRSEVVRHAAALVEGVSPEPPAIPLRKTWSRVHEAHFLLWAYRGDAVVRVGSRHIELQRGEAVWVPAGVPYALEYPAGSIAIPVGDSQARVRLAVDGLRVFATPPEVEAFLLHTSVVSYTLFKPETERASFTEELFRAQFVADQVAPPTRLSTSRIEVVTRALHRDPADSRSLTDWASHLHTSPRELGREFLTQTGESFTRWRSKLRMFRARELLEIGDPPGDVAKRLGYASPAAFANAFSAAHGMSARQYQRRATEGQADATITSPVQRRRS